MTTGLVIARATLSIVCFILGGIGLYYDIPYSGWAIFIAVIAALSIT